MSISFYEASVGTYQQVLGSVAGIMDKGAAFAAENEIGLEEIVGTRLRDDMMRLHPSSWIRTTRSYRHWSAKLRRVWHPFQKARWPS
jgi:hypothetical protein